MPKGMVLGGPFPSEFNGKKKTPGDSRDPGMQGGRRKIQGSRYPETEGKKRQTQHEYLTLWNERPTKGTG